MNLDKKKRKAKRATFELISFVHTDFLEKSVKRTQITGGSEEKNDVLIQC